MLAKMLLIFATIAESSDSLESENICPELVAKMQLSTEGAIVVISNSG
jgi:hypothetical protein